MSLIKAYAAQSATSPVAPFEIDRRAPKATDVEIDILFCGVCHSDLHQARNDWKNSLYPMVPGHEIVGKVTKVGQDVTKFAVGDLAAVGCMVDSCRTCPNCADGLEQYCIGGELVFTYNSEDKKNGGLAQGGYSTSIVVDEAFTLKLPANLDLAATAPLLCAGITTYSPLRHWKVGPGQKVAILGLGGLGHMGVKFAKAFGATVVVLTTSPGKTEDAKKLGADEVIISTDPEQMKANAGTLDFILDTAAATHDINPYLALLARDGTLCQVGVPDEPASVPSFSLVMGRKSFAGSAIGGIAETQEMLEFCGEHNIVSDIEIIDIKDINEAYERMLKNDVKYRFVIDIATLK